MKPSTFVFIAAGMFAAVTVAQQPFEAINTRQPRREREVVHGIPISSGTVIVAGRRLLTPHRVGRQGRFIFVNDVRVAELPLGPGSDGKEKRKPGGSDPDRFIANIENWLFNDYTLVVFDERVRIVADPDDALALLKSLAEATSLDERVARALKADIDVSDDGKPHRMSTSQWRRALAGFQVSDSLRELIVEHNALATGAKESGLRDDYLSIPLDRGFLFVDGQYVPRPYIFRKESGAYFVNGINIATLGIDLSCFEEEAKGHQDPLHRKKSIGELKEPIATLYGDLFSALNNFDSVLLIPGFPMVVYELSRVGGGLLQVLVDDERRIATSTNVSDWKPGIPLDPTDQQRLAVHLAEWLKSYRPSPAFLADATAQLEILDAAQIENENANAANVRLTTFSYPLTVFTIVLVVLVFGHLLSHRPNTELWNDNSATQPLRDPFIHSLVLIMGLSVVDLVWTLLVSQAGAMHEVNPIGIQMIDDPWKLVAFKVVVTLNAVGLLYFCRRAPLARQASWWSCLVLSLVAARWLVFNSMFIS